MIRLRVILAQTLLFAASAGAATIDLAKWQYFAEVTIEDGRSEYCGLTLSPEVYSVARTDLADIRLIDGDGRQIPYILAREEDTAETVKYGPTILNRSTDAAGNAFLTLDVGEPAFYRCVTILGRDAATRKVKIDSEDSRQRFTEVEVPWNMVTTDAIYRYADPAGEERQHLVLPVRTGGSYRYLKVVVNNYDDQPITIRSASAKMIRHRVVFPAAADKSLRVYVGCESAGHPRYDLARRIGKVDEVKTTAAGIAALTDNPLFRKTAEGQKPWTEQHRILLLVVLSAVVLVLGVFMVKSLKSIQSQTGGGK